MNCVAPVPHEGHLAAKLQASYDLLLARRLILQPQVEVNIYSKADPVRLVGAGFSDIDTGLRLRYEITRYLPAVPGAVTAALPPQSRRSASPLLSSSLG